MTVPGDTATGHLSSSRDVADIENTGRELLRLNRTLRALSNCTQAMLRASEESEFLAEVCRIIVEDCGHAMAWIGFAEEDEGKTVRPVAQAGCEQGFLNTLHITWADTERGRGPTGTAIRTGQAAVCRNMLTDPRFAPWREEALKRGYASSIVFPLKAEGRVFGSLSIYASEPDRFSDEEVGLLAEMAADLAFGVTAIRTRVARGAAEETLRRSEERHRLLFENMLDGFAFCEMLFEEGKPRDFRYLAVNRAFEALTGLKDVVGRKVSEVIPGVQTAHPELFEIYGRVSLTGRPERFEIHLQPLNAWFAISVYSSETGYFTAVFDNITDRKRAESRLRDLNETLENRVAERTAEAERRAEQLRALASEFSQAEGRVRQRLAIVLHDHFQQILVAAKLNLDALKASVVDGGLRPLAARVEVLLDQSIAECRSLTTALSPPVLMDAGLAGGIAWLARRMREQHGLKVDVVVGDNWAEPADGDAKIFLFESVRELLFNVVKHSGVQEARVALGRGEGHVEIRVEDRGRGLEEKAARRLGDEAEGFGLLSIRERLDLVRGVMRVESAPGSGTSVTLCVPARPVSAKAATVAPAPESAPVGDTAGTVAAPARSGRIRVVIADDHKLLRQGLIALLTSERGTDVVGEAADGVEAVELARTLKPDVIIMDVSMPKMNGVEATRRILAEDPDVRVIGLSMYDDETIAASMHEAGAVAFVTKGGPSDALTAAIHAAVSDGRRP